MAPSSPQHTCNNAVCVMDASTHLGAALVDRLLRLGFFVHAAVHTNVGEFMFNNGCHNNKKLKIFHSDPFDYVTILDALRGCCGLFYTFDPPPNQQTTFHDVSCLITSPPFIIFSCTFVTATKRVYKYFYFIILDALTGCLRFSLIFLDNGSLDAHLCVKDISLTFFKTSSRTFFVRVIRQCI